MSRLPNLKRISVLDRFPWRLDCNTWVHVNHEWYKDWSKHAFDGIAHPSSWTPTRFSDNGREILRQYPWDFRGVDNLLEAALLHTPNLRELLVGCQNSILSDEIYGRPDIVETFRSLVSRLSLLKIDAWKCRFSDITDTVAMILHKAQNLEELHLTRCYGFQGLVMKWSRLRVLDLGDEFATWAAFEAVIHSCANTLRELRLRDVHLYGKAWVDCSRDLGPYLRLQFVAISAMTDDVASRMNQEAFSLIKLHESQSTALNFMSSVSRSDLGFVSCEVGYQAMAWHKGEFMINSRIDFASREWNWNHDLPKFAS